MDWMSLLKDVGSILGFTNTYGLTGGGGMQQQVCSTPGYVLKNGQCYPPTVDNPQPSYPTWLPYAVIGVGALTLAVIVKKIMK